MRTSTCSRLPVILCHTFTSFPCHVTPPLPLFCIVSQSIRVHFQTQIPLSTSDGKIARVLSPSSPLPPSITSRKVFSRTNSFPRLFSAKSLHSKYCSSVMNTFVSNIGRTSNHSATSYAFLPYLPLKTPLRSPSLCKRRLRNATCMNALPNDTALDMVSFALSGPGLYATAAFALTGAVLIFSLAEIGPRRDSIKGALFLRVNIPLARSIELPDGTVSRLREGENLLPFESLEACRTVAKRLEEPSVTYSIYITKASGIKELSTYPRNLDAAGAKWPRNLIGLREESNLQARWDEYEQISSRDSVDDEWSSLMKNLSPIQFIARTDCRLCGGTGTVRCFRCGGVGSRRNFQCDCMRGKRVCEWCGNS